jgi:DNA repair protein RadA/Sms
VGWDANRLAMVLAVLETRCGLVIGPRDIYLNVAGGLKVGEPAADLAVAGALVSSVLDVPLPHDAVLFGEIGLAGEVRQVAQAGARLKEASKLGFTQALVPPAGDLDQPGGLELIELRRLIDLVERLDLAGRGSRAARPPGARSRASAPAGGSRGLADLE